MKSLQKRLGLMVAMLLMVTLISGCRGQLTVTVPLPMLVNNPAAFDDRQIVTQGVVRHFNDPLHYWIEDEQLNRVEIFPHQEIAPYLDESVEVEGQFHFSPNEGRRLTLTRVDQLPGE
ncbi:hypothetical protein ACM25P_11425 [Vreelandella alkaliphila]|uniref:hypothetical protein n=1 Tax=Halomonadaceae TaxID=28256 RepID=UPI001E35429F|nr:MULTISPECIES: hypothetical protein [Halomonas]MCD6005271.1 glucose-inhibited division protein B [Halomonas sp. IOP_6]MCD6439483.1 glucose-inhibited division protein B [Halomonas sp.]